MSSGNLYLPLDLWGEGQKKGIGGYYEGLDFGR